MLMSFARCASCLFLLSGCGKVLGIDGTFGIASGATPGLQNDGGPGEIDGEAALACAKNEHVSEHRCVACPAGTTNDAGDNADGEDSSCEPVVCDANEHVSYKVCVPCPPGTSRNPGDVASLRDTSCGPIACAEDEHVVEHRCVPCPAGSQNGAGDSASEANTTCVATVCGEGEHVLDHQCSACPAGKTRAAGDVASGNDTACASILCPEDHFVVDHDCAACPAGARNDDGDNASGGNTACASVLCGENEHVERHSCRACPSNTSNRAGDRAVQGDTSCDTVLCSNDEYVHGRSCVACPIGTTREAGDDPLGEDTACSSILCGKDQRVRSHVCVACPPGTERETGDDAAGADTLCVPVECQEQERVMDHACVACSRDTANDAGDLASDGDTKCPSDDCSMVFGVSCRQFAQAFLKADNGKKMDQFGTSVSLDGDTLVVGAPYQDHAAHSDVGGVYVFERDDGGHWSQQAHLKALNYGRGDHFGFRVSLDGDTLAVGAPEEDGHPLDAVMRHGNGNTVENSGAVYVFVRSQDGYWSQQAYVKAPNGKEYDRFGTSVGLEQDRLVVGSPYRGAGAIYVFERNMDGNWMQKAHINAPSNGSSDRFGLSLSLQGNTLATSAASGGTTSGGAVYVFARSRTGHWPQQAQLQASNGDSQDNFGYSISLDRDTLAVGAVGEDSDATGVNGSQFNEKALDSGAVYVFVRDCAGRWAQQAYLKASNTEKYDWFGASVALDGDTLAVGASFEDGAGAGISPQQGNNGSDNSGAVYLFKRGGARQWSQQAYVKASNTGTGDALGFAVSLDGHTMAVGANFESSRSGRGQNDNEAGGSGAVYVRRIAR